MIDVNVHLDVGASNEFLGCVFCEAVAPVLCDCVGGCLHFLLSAGLLLLLHLLLLHLLLIMIMIATVVGWARHYFVMMAFAFVGFGFCE